MADPRSRAGGINIQNDYEKILSSDINQRGTIAEQFASFLMSVLLRSEPGNDERTGFVGDGCLVTVSSGLTMQVAAGVGFYDDTAESDAYDMVYKPIVVATAFTSGLTLDAHDATNPRIDIICLAPDTVDEDSQSRHVIDPTDGADSSSSVYKRRRNTYAVSVVAGTPAATPAAPSTPAGYVKIAECLVPASSGAVTVTDTRPTLQLTEGLPTPPPTEYHQNWVPGSSTELQVTASSPASMVLHIAAGTADVRGTRVVLRQATTVTVDAANPTNPRIDLVVVYDDGTVDTVAGTADPSPTAPADPADGAVLAQIAVAAAASTLNSGTITDARVREPYSGALITDATITPEKMSVTHAIANITVGAEASNIIAVVIAMKDADGNSVTRSVRCLVELVDDQGAPVASGYEMTLAVGTRAVSAHSVYSGSATVCADQGWIVDSSALGLIQMTVEDTTTGANRGVWLKVTPFGTPGSPGIADLPFN